MQRRTGRACPRRNGRGPCFWSRSVSRSACTSLTPGPPCEVTSPPPRSSMTELLRDARDAGGRGDVRRLVIGALLVAAMLTSASAEDRSPPSAVRFVTLNLLHGGPLSGWTGRDSH